jgi:hypothetical protein
MQIRRLAVRALRAAADKLEGPPIDYWGRAFDVAEIENSPRRIGDVQTESSRRRGVSWVLLRPRLTVPLLTSGRGPELWITNKWQSPGKFPINEVFNELLPRMAKDGTVPSKIYLYNLGTVYMYKIESDGRVNSMRLLPGEARKALSGTLRWKESSNRQWFRQGLGPVYQHVMRATFGSKPSPLVVV